MSIRKILVPLDGSEADRAALPAAFRLPRTFDAHVLAMHVRVEPTDALPFVGEGMSAALVQELVDLTEREDAARAAAARQTFDRAAESAPIPGVCVRDAGAPSAEWAGVVGREDDAIVRSAGSPI